MTFFFFLKIISIYDVNSWSFIQLLEILPIELTRTHYKNLDLIDC